MGRICIFSIINEKNKIEECTFFLLEQVEKCVEKLFIVLNKKISKDEYNRLGKYSHDILTFTECMVDYKANKMEKFLSFMNETEEIVFMNDSCYGPMYSIEEIFANMKKQDVDFWGITGRMNNVWRETGEIQYIHSYFFSISHKFVCSDDFNIFIDRVSCIDNLKSTIAYFEKEFYRFFTEKGYRGDVYIKDEAIDLDEDERLDNLLFDSYRLLSEYNCPFVSKDALINNHERVLLANAGETARKTMDYIKNETSYDENLIWEDIIHNYDVGCIRNAFHLDYVFHTKGKMKKKKIEKSVAVIAHVNYTDLIEHCFSYLKKIPDYIDIYITTKGESNIKIISEKIEGMDRKNIRIIVPEDRGREIAAMLVACKDILMKYEYLCFVHDKKNNAGEPHRTVGQSFMDILWENTIKNDIYIENVLKQFEEEPKLGLLAPPVPYMAMFFTAGANGWTTCYDETQKLAARLNLECIMDKKNQPFVFGTTFWCRTDALQPLFESGIGYEDFCQEPMPVDGTISHAIERIFPYVAQSRGYYSGIMMTDEYASLYTANCQYMLNTTLQKVLYDEGIEQYNDIHNREERVKKFCDKFEEVYIYGVGLCGKACLSYVLKYASNKMKGFIVSDEYRSRNAVKGIRIYEVSEVTPKENVGILVAVSRRYLKEIKSILRIKGFENVGVYLEDFYEVV